MEQASLRLYPGARAAALGFAALLALAAGVVGWGASVSVSGAVVASGRVEARGSNRAVESASGGVVMEVLVEEGGSVVRGQALVRLAGGELESRRRMVEAHLGEVVARRCRLQAEVRGLEDIAWDPWFEARRASSPAARDAMAGQERLFAARREARDGEAARLEERTRQAEEEISGLEARARAVDAQAALIARELGIYRELVERGLTRLERLLALERAAEGLKGAAGGIAAQIARTRGQIAEHEVQALQAGARFLEAAEEDLRNVPGRGRTSSSRRCARSRSGFRRARSGRRLRDGCSAWAALPPAR